MFECMLHVCMMRERMVKLVHLESGLKIPSGDLMHHKSGLLVFKIICTDCTNSLY